MSNNELLHKAIHIAKEAGKLTLTFFGKPYNVFHKGRIDLVTEADKASEALIVKRINEYYPDHSIYGEETTDKQGTEPYRWIIDPIDGTTNFANNHPVYSVSIGIEYNNEIIIGVVFIPYLNELYYASLNKGAFFTNNIIKDPVKIGVSKTDQLVNSVLATGFAYNRKESGYNNVDNFERILMQCRGMRRSGSAALDLCYTAHGRYDGYWEYNLNKYDIAAGALIVNEAGGIVSDWNNKNKYLQNGDIVAANPIIHPELIKNLSTLPDTLRLNN